MIVIYQIRVSIPCSAGMVLERTFLFADRLEAEKFAKLVERHPAAIRVVGTSINHLMSAGEALDEVDEEINLDARLAYSEQK